MSEDFDPRDELTERLSAIGRHPVSPALQSEHLTAMAGVARGASWRSMLASRVKLGAAVLGGFLIGTTGLASAGAMGPLQPIAKTTVEAVTPFEVPAGKGGNSEEAKKNRGQAKKAAGSAVPKAGKHWGPECNTAFSMKNRGQYLQSAKAADAADTAGATTHFKTARDSDCGKGLNPDGTIDESDDDGVEDDAAVDGTKDQGKSAGKRQNGKDKADKADKGADDDADEDADDESNGGRGGKSGITEAPGTGDGATPAEPAPAEGQPETPETPAAPVTPETPAADDKANTDNPGGGSSNSGGGSDKSGPTAS